MQSKDSVIPWYCSRAALHRIHSVFPSPVVSEHPEADPVSLKKLKAGEGFVGTWKELLRWMMD